MKTSVDRKMFNMGYYMSLFGSVLILVWIGIFKFTATEAAGIKDLVVNHPFMSWMYDVFSDQMVSNIIGFAEILIGMTLVLSLKYEVLRKYAAWGLIGTFLVTISFLFTTPGVWKTVEGVPVTNFFILKDMMYMGFGLMLMNLPQPE